MRYLFFIAVYKRLKVTRKCFENLAKLQKDNDIQVFCVCSNLDEASLCYEFGFDYMITENIPLGRKFNRGLKEAMKFNFTHLIQLGSDDIITQDLLDAYNGVDAAYFGINRYHLTNGKEAKFWIYGHEGQEIFSPIGAGRVFTKGILIDTLSIGKLWSDDICMGLDGNSDTNMMLRGFRCELIDFEGVGIIDMKTEENLHSYEDVKGCEDVDIKILEEWL